MLKLKSVTLRNFRLVNDATFEPLLEGLTGIAGENGVGKSSFLTGVLWALFDVRPDDVPTSGLRRQGTAPSDECFVQVVFIHDNDEIEVIRELRGKSNRVVVNIYVNGQEQTHTSVKVANDWIRKRLGIDANAFMTAFAVRQKELDDLINARPAERRATIERLSGIEKLSTALKKAREEENSLKRTVSGLPGSEEDIAVAQAALEAAEAELVNVTGRLEALSQEVADKKSSVEQSVMLLQELEELNTQVYDASSALERARAEVKSLEDRIEDQKKSAHPATEEDVNSAREKFNTLESTLVEIRNSYTEAASRRNVLASVKTNALAESERAQKKHERLVKDLELAKNASTNVEKLATEIEDKKNAKLTIDNQIGTLNGSASVVKSSIESAELAVAALRKTDAHAECPTCHTHLEDVTGLVNSFEKQLSEQREQLSAIEEEIKAHQGVLSQVVQELSSLEARLLDERSVANGTSHLPSAIAEEESIIAANRSKIDLCDEEDRQLSETLEEAKTRGQKLASEVEEARNILTLAEQGIKSTTAITALSKELTAAKNALQDAQKSLDESKSIFLAKGNFSNTDVRTQFIEFKAKVESDRNALEQSQSTLSSLAVEHSVAQGNVAAARKTVESEEGLFNRKRNTLALLSDKSAVSDVLDEFRKDRIARIAPELSETATSMISAMTSGRYTEVLLDDDFTPSVVDEDGNVRPVSWLSGGEVSAVALALRVAIGDLITDGVGGILWLDEVLTAQDAGRRASLLNTLSGIPGRQIIMINHTPGASDMVDKIVHIVATENGSFMAE